MAANLQSAKVSQNTARQESLLELQASAPIRAADEAFKSDLKMFEDLYSKVAMSPRIVDIGLSAAGTDSLVFKKMREVYPVLLTEKRLGQNKGYEGNEEWFDSVFDSFCLIQKAWRGSRTAPDKIDKLWKTFPRKEEALELADLKRWYGTMRQDQARFKRDIENYINRIDPESLAFKLLPTKRELQEFHSNVLGQLTEIKNAYERHVRFGWPHNNGHGFDVWRSNRSIVNIWLDRVKRSLPPNIAKTLRNAPSFGPVEPSWIQSESRFQKYFLEHTDLMELYEKATGTSLADLDDLTDVERNETDFSRLLIEMIEAKEFKASPENILSIAQDFFDGEITIVGKGCLADLRRTGEKAMPYAKKTPMKTVAGPYSSMGS